MYACVCGSVRVCLCGVPPATTSRRSSHVCLGACPACWRCCLCSCVTPIGGPGRHRPGLRVGLLVGSFRSSPSSPLRLGCMPAGVGVLCGAVGSRRPSHPALGCRRRPSLGGAVKACSGCIVLRGRLASVSPRQLAFFESFRLHFRAKFLFPRYPPVSKPLAAT